MDYPEPHTAYTRYLYNRKVDGVVAISQNFSAAGGQGSSVKNPLDLHWDRPAPFEPLPVLMAKPNGCDWHGCGFGKKGHRFLFEARRLKAQGYQIQYWLAGEGSLRKCGRDGNGWAGNEVLPGPIWTCPLLSKIDIAFYRRCLKASGVGSELAAGRIIAGESEGSRS
jgi:hypothetical protein